MTPPQPGSDAVNLKEKTKREREKKKKEESMSYSEPCTGTTMTTYLQLGIPKCPSGLGKQYRSSYMLTTTHYQPLIIKLLVRGGSEWMQFNRLDSYSPWKPTSKPWMFISSTYSNVENCTMHIPVALLFHGPGMRSRVCVPGKSNTSWLALA